ncbi:MAG: PorT family protein [Bacteroidales bacterium]|nr:PorT family protein [Bacteroidales bacterium]
MNRSRIGLLLVSWLFLVAGGPALSQGFDGGLRGGIAASEVSGDNLGGPDKLGWFAAVFTSTGVGTYSRLQLELLYIQKGSRSRPNEKNNFYDYRFSLQYVEVPLVLIYDFPFGENMRHGGRLSLEAGLSLAFLVAALEKENDLEIDLAQEKPYNEAELNFLLGLYYPVADRLKFHLRFSQGITPLRPHLGGSQTWYNRGQYNTVWTFGLAWSLL